MRVLITGADGYVGSVLQSELGRSHVVTGTSRKVTSNQVLRRLDIRDSYATHEVVAAEQPDVIVHCAAIAGVAACEASPSEAIRTNSAGTENVAHAAKRVGARVILLSSLAARSKATAYGRSKQAAEAAVRRVGARHDILRLSMTFGLSPNTTSRRPYNKILSTAKNGAPRLYDDAWQFQPTYTGHVLDVVCRLLSGPSRQCCISVTTAERCTMYRLASDVLAPRVVEAAPIYAERHEVHVDPEHLGRHGMPSLSYASLVRSLRAELAAQR